MAVLGIGGKKGKHAKTAYTDPAGAAPSLSSDVSALPPTGIQETGSPLMGGFVPRHGPDEYGLLSQGTNTGIGSVGRVSNPFRPWTPEIGQPGGGGVPEPNVPGGAGPGGSPISSGWQQPTPFDPNSMSWLGTENTNWDPNASLFDLGYSLEGGPSLSDGAWKDPNYAADRISGMWNARGGLWNPMSVLGDMQGADMWSMNERLQKDFWGNMANIPGPFGGSLLQPNMENALEWAKMLGDATGYGEGKGLTDPALLKEILGAGAEVMDPYAQKAAGYITPNEVRDIPSLFQMFKGMQSQSPFGKLAEGWAESRDPNDLRAYDSSGMEGMARDIAGAGQSNLKRMLGDKFGGLTTQGGGQAAFGREIADTITQQMLSGQMDARQQSYNLLPQFAQALGQFDPTMRSSDQAMNVNLADLQEQGRRQIGQANAYGSLMKPISGAVQGATGMGGNSALQSMPIEMWQNMLGIAAPMLQQTPFESANLLATLGGMRNDTLGGYIINPAMSTAMQAAQWGHERDMQRRGGRQSIEQGLIGGGFGLLGDLMPNATGGAGTGAGNAMSGSNNPGSMGLSQQAQGGGNEWGGALGSVGNVFDGISGLFGGGDNGLGPSADPRATQTPLWGSGPNVPVQNPSGNPTGSSTFRTATSSPTSAAANTGPLDYGMGNPWGANAIQQQMDPWQLMGLLGIGGGGMY